MGRDAETWISPVNTKEGENEYVRVWMSICTGCSVFPALGGAVRLAVYAVGRARIHYGDLAHTRDHLSPVYNPDVCVGLQSSCRRDRLGLVLGDSRTLTRHLIV